MVWDPGIKRPNSIKVLPRNVIICTPVPMVALSNHCVITRRYLYSPLSRPSPPYCLHVVCKIWKRGSGPVNQVPPNIWRHTHAALR